MDKDDVLFRFHRVAHAITPDLVEEWTKRYPQFAADIRAHAVEVLDADHRAKVHAITLGEVVGDTDARRIERLATEG